MSLYHKGLSCVRCKSYLFDDDDIVYCPVCGAPHHRDCYNELGHCALEELHGTENEYSREKILSELKAEEPEAIPEKENRIKCRMCGEEYENTLSRCPNCNSPDLNKMGGFATFDLLGGVPADCDLGDGVTADDAKQFVMANTHRYIPKFASFQKKGKISWNWMAFLFPSAWMFSRKMYKGGIITALITILSNLMRFPFTKWVNSVGIDMSRYSAEAVKQLSEKLPEAGGAIILLAFFGGVLSLALCLFCGMLGDYIYKKHTVSAVKKIKQESEDINEDYRKKGGVNLMLFLVTAMGIQYLSVILMMFM